LFTDIYTGALKQGVLPPIDAAFYQAFHTDSSGHNAWVGLMRKTGDQLRDEDRRGELLALAWQCHQLGDPATTDELLGKVLAGLAEKLRPAATLAVVEVYVLIGQYPRADELLQGILEDKRAQDSPGVWRLAAQVAFQRGLTARGVTTLEKALDLEFRNL